ALVAINSFGDNLRQAVDDEARTLLGADLSFEDDQPFSEEIEALIDSLGGEQSRRVSFASMVLFPKTDLARLATVRAIEGRYPYYGVVETTPPEAAARYLTEGGALVDKTLMQQAGAQVGDSIRIGGVTYRIAGQLEKTPRESSAMMLFSPRVYIPLARLDTTLLQRGSRAEYEVYFRFEDGRDAEALQEALRPRLREAGVGSDTVEEIKENWDEGLTNLYRFLSLVGFVALLLGGLGVASAVHVYVKQRIDTVAVLRCLGATSRRTFGVYLVQAAAMGLLGGGIGAVLGIGIQTLLPRVLGDFLPVDLAFRVSWPAVALGVGIGVGVTLLFALLPLLGVRNVSPLRALRAAYEERGGYRDPLRWVVFGLLAAGITTFAVVQAPRWIYGVWYAVGIAVVFGLLALTARAIMVLTRKFFPTSWPYTWRQGLANLYRPNNQTLILMLVLGLGTFLIMTLYLAQSTLLAQINVATEEGQPDLVLFDVQPDQVDGVVDSIRAQGVPVLDRVPIVTMRLQAVKGRTIAEMRADSTTRVSWAHRREYRSSYRGALTDAERLVAGRFTGSVPPGTAVAPVSLEQEIARDLEVGLGDTLVWDVQGVPITTVVGSIREVDWRRLSTNFFAVFPEGVLEQAPQFFVVLARTKTAERAAAVQSAVVQAYPNVSSIDLSLVMGVFDAIFSRVSFAIRFMALFSILTGIIVLAGAVVVSRFQRISESVLLKTLGASRRQVYRIMLVEYLFLGVFATLTGVVLAVGGSWALAVFVFEAPFQLPLWPLLGTLVTVTGLTIGIGLLNSRGVYDRPPLEVLRAETA
ncbi:MAG: FtsX-like permease family protein, partial [Bacteroidetes bacterium]